MSESPPSSPVDDDDVDGNAVPPSSPGEEDELSAVRVKSMQRIKSRRRKDSRASSRHRSSVTRVDMHIQQQALQEQPHVLLAIEEAAGVYKHPNSLFDLKFRDPDMERRFREQHDRESTGVFRAWALLFILFHVVTFLAFDLTWHGGPTDPESRHTDEETLIRTVRYARVPSLGLAIVCWVVTLLPDWNQIPKQAFFAASLLIQIVFLLLVTFTTLEDDHQVALPNAAIAAVIVGYTSYRLRMRWATFVGWSSQLLATLAFLYALQTDMKDLSWRAMYFNIPMGVFNVLGMMTCYQIERSERESFHHARQFLKESAITKYETDRGEFIIYNILPRRIVQRLKLQPTIAEKFESVTVMFICIENLIDITDFSETRKSVQFMNDLFEVCDKRADEYGVEKVKTINDKYMCVCGAPDKRPDHAEAMADMALAVWEDFNAMQSDQRSFTFRAGMSSGRIVAGVIGLQKFSWDIWGDTVNTASRMEYPKGGAKLSGAIRISEHTHDRLKDTHECEYKGELEVKGKGLLKTYRLVRRTAGQEKRFVDALPEEEEEEEEKEQKVADVITRQVSLIQENDQEVADFEKLILEAAENEDDVDLESVSANYDDNVIGDVEDEEKEEDEDEKKRIAMSQLRGSSQPMMTVPSSPTGGGADQNRVRLRPRLVRRRSSAIRAHTTPHLDVNGFIDNMDFDIPDWSEMSEQEKQRFFESRFEYNRTMRPTLRFSLVVAVVLWGLLGIMDASIDKRGTGMDTLIYVARYGVVVPLWLAHLGVTWAHWYTVHVSSFLGLLSVLIMVASSSIIQRKIEGQHEEGAEFYAPLPVCFAIYLCYSVFAMPSRWLYTTVTCAFAYLVVEAVLGYTLLEEGYFLVWLFGLSVFGIYISHTLEGLAFQQWHLVQSARMQHSVMENKHKEADQLLRNIVPAEVIPVLTSYADTSGVARSYDNVAILFSDIAGFTNMSKDLQPRQLVNWLNIFFVTFDKLAKAHGVQKIKTIGDAYVCCSGLLGDYKEDHVNDIVNMAINLQEVLTERNREIKEKPGKRGLPVSLRIGIHVGTVLAGIIGRRKFQYDIFGKSIVLAEEMESSGAVGQVHISQTCRDALVRADHTYKFREGEPCSFADERTGEERQMPTWFVEHKSLNRMLAVKLQKVLGAGIDFNVHP